MVHNKSHLYVHLTTALALVVFFIAIPPLVSYVYKIYFFDPPHYEMNRKLDSVQALILEDLKFLQGQPVFLEHSYNANANDIIISALGWESSSAANENPEGSFAHFINSNEFDLDWKKLSQLELQHFSDKAMREPKIHEWLSWMEKLGRFDHWNFMSSAEYQTHLKDVNTLSSVERVGVAARLPMPRYGLLRHYAAFFFLKKQSEGRGEEGLIFVRRLANLTQSSGTLAAHMTAVHLLQLENHFQREFVIGDAGITESQILAYKRVAWAWPGIFALSLQTPRWQTFESYLSVGNGMCGAVYEQLIGATALGDFLDPHWPLEIDVQPAREMLDAQILKMQKQCHGTALSAFQSPPPNPKWWTDDGVFKVSRDPAQQTSHLAAHLNLAKIPYIRQIVGMEFVTFAVPNYFSQYENK